MPISLKTVMLPISREIRELVKDLQKTPWSHRSQVKKNLLKQTIIPATSAGSHLSNDTQWLNLCIFRQPEAVRSAKYGLLNVISFCFDSLVISRTYKHFVPLWRILKYNYSIFLRFKYNIFNTLTRFCTSSVNVYTLKVQFGIMPLSKIRHISSH